MSVICDNTPEISISVVICFRDWGLDRLIAAVRLHRMNIPQDVTHEVIVSDYGSQDPEKVRQAVEAAGGRVVRTETNAPWSRSAALNAGVEDASTNYIITTDADIVFTPGAYESALDLLGRQPNVLYLIQCRDLPAEWAAKRLLGHAETKGTVDFDQLESVASIRPRWGMGGFAAFTAQSYYALNGYEERMKIWGKEDNDFAQRFRRLGMPVRWISNEKAKIYHMWHAPSLKKAEEDEATRRALKENQRILDEEVTLVRNLIGKKRVSIHPAVSVVIATYKRSKKLYQALLSCQRQTFGNFEAIVIENGESDEAQDVVESLGDPRFRYIKTARQGAAVARNIGTLEALAKFIVIHDDDDLMCSTRIEDHLRILQAGDHGSYGGWIDFDDDAGEILSRNPGKEMNFASVLFAGKVLIHPATMIRREVLEAFPYDETRQAGIDYALFLKLVRNGLSMRHTGCYAILRRMHANNMTCLNSAIQKESADDMKQRILAEMSEAEKTAERKRGKEVKTLTCDNESQVMAELQRLSGKPLPATSDVLTLSDLEARLRSRGMQDEYIVKALQTVSHVSTRDHKDSAKRLYLASRVRFLSGIGQLSVEIVD